MNLIPRCPEWMKKGPVIIVLVVGEHDKYGLGIVVQVLPFTSKKDAFPPNEAHALAEILHHGMDPYPMHAFASDCNM